MVPQLRQARQGRIYEGPVYHAVGLRGGKKESARPELRCD